MRSHIVGAHVGHLGPKICMITDSRNYAMSGPSSKFAAENSRVTWKFNRYFRPRGRIEAPTNLKRTIEERKKRPLHPNPRFLGRFQWNSPIKVENYKTYPILTSSFFVESSWAQLCRPARISFRLEESRSRHSDWDGCMCIWCASLLLFFFWRGSCQLTSWREDASVSTEKSIGASSQKSP